MHPVQVVVVRTQTCAEVNVNFNYIRVLLRLHSQSRRAVSGSEPVSVQFVAYESDPKRKPNHGCATNSVSVDPPRATVACAWAYMLVNCQYDVPDIFSISVKRDEPKKGALGLTGATNKKKK